MVYEMKLEESPFERIKNGTKTIEFRLYDEKRRKIKIGDEIKFYKLPDLQEQLVVEVLEIYIAETFEKLFSKIYTNKSEIEKYTKSMSKYYSYEKERKYGVVGIKIKMLKK